MLQNKEMDAQERKLYARAFALAVFTVLYNIAEGVISTSLGFEEESLTLFGFGADSFIEVISGIGIAHMVLRIKASKASRRDEFERKALRITGVAFYLLVLVLVAIGVYNAIQGHKPDNTMWGILISSISIGVMWFTIRWKTNTGKALHSEAILADAECARVCIYMSVILLVSSAVYTITGFAYTDSIGALGLAYFSFKEGRECFEKARSNALCSCDHSLNKG